MKGIFSLFTGNPIFSAVSLLVLVALIAFSYAAGRNDGRALEKSVWAQAENKQLKDIQAENAKLKTEAENLRKANKDKEIKHSEDTNKIDVKLQELQHENKLEKNRLVIALRDARKLQNKPATSNNEAQCGNSATSSPKPSTSIADGETRVQLYPKVEDTIVEMMYEADDNTDQLILLQEYTNKLYSFCSTQ